MNRRLARVIKRWKRTDAWWDEKYELEDPELLRSFLLEADFPSSGRLMWNLGMWLDEHWSDLSADLQMLALRRITEAMQRAKHNRAYGLWKVGDTLGEHIGAPRAKTALFRVLESDCSERSHASALHGLVHYVFSHRRSRDSIIERLQRLAKRQKDTAVRGAYRKALGAMRKGHGCCTL